MRSTQPDLRKTSSRDHPSLAALAALAPRAALGSSVLGRLGDLEPEPRPTSVRCRSAAPGERGAKIFQAEMLISSG